jgi:hypothetical protein
MQPLLPYITQNIPITDFYKDIFEFRISHNDQNHIVVCSPFTRQQPINSNRRTVFSVVRAEMLEAGQL